MKRLYTALLIGTAACAFNQAHASSLTLNAISAPPSSLVTYVASETTIKGAENFVDNMTKRGINFLGDENMTKEEQKAEFDQLLNDSFDMETIGRFALGKHWRSASGAQQKEYQSLFKKMILEVYSARFSDYRGQELEVTGARAEGKADVLVNSVIKGHGEPEVSVDWRVRYANGQYKVIDVIVAGVSMGLTQRSDFASVIQRGGGNINVLLEHLRK